MTIEQLTLLTGTTGATIILIAFLLNQLNIWKNNSFLYDLANLLGSILLIVYAVLLTSYPFIALNVVWALVSLKDVANQLRN